MEKQTIIEVSRVDYPAQIEFFTVPIRYEEPPNSFIDRNRRFWQAFDHRTNKLADQATYRNFDGSLVPRQITLGQAWAAQKARGPRRQTNGRFKPGHRRDAIHWEEPWDIDPDDIP